MLGAFCLSVIAGPASAGQQPASPPPAPAAGSQEKPAPVERPKSDTADSYSYNPDGRRDPFQSLVNRGATAATTGTRQPGLAGWLVAEVSLKGVIRNQGALVGILQGPDDKTFLVRTGDRLFDGTVKEVVTDAVIFSQDVHDPLSLVKQREVRKPLRPMEEPK